MPARKVHTPEAIAEARRLYERTRTPVKDIMLLLGLTTSAFYKRVRKWGWRRRLAKSGAFELARALSEPGFAHPSAAADASREAPPVGEPPVTPERRAALAERIQSVIEREISVIEQAIGLLQPTDQPEAERVMRTLSTISRAVVEVAALNQPPDVTKPDDSADDAIPDDIDAFRDELARRIHALIDAG